MLQNREAREVSFLIPSENKIIYIFMLGRDSTKKRLTAGKVEKNKKENIIEENLEEDIEENLEEDKEDDDDIDLKEKTTTTKKRGRPRTKVNTTKK